MNKITILIPTRNRSEFIDDFINISLKEYSGNLFNILIVDSSSDDKTAIAVSLYNKETIKKINYFRLPFDTKVDEKVLFGISKVKTDFLYLQNDKYITDLNALEKFLNKNKFYQYDILNINNCKSFFYKYNKKKIINNIYESTDLLKFCSQSFSYMSLYGASIVKTNLLKCKNAQDVWANFKDANYGCYLYVSAVFSGAHYLANNNSKYGISFVDFIKINNKKSISWNSGISWFETFFSEFNRDVDLLPTYFDSIKNYIIIQYHKDWNQISLRGLINYKATGTLRFSYVRQYKKEIKRCHYHYGLMIFVSLFIPSFICRGIKTIFQKIKRLITK